MLAKCTKQKTWMFKEITHLTTMYFVHVTGTSFQNVWDWWKLAHYPSSFQGAVATELSRLG